MPGGKLRLKGLFTGGIQVGTTGDYAKHILAGSLTVNVGSVTGAGSTVCEVGTITGLTASHIIMVNERFSSLNACLALAGARAGAGTASFNWVYTAGSALGTAASHAAVVEYLAVKV